MCTVKRLKIGLCLQECGRLLVRALVSAVVVNAGFRDVTGRRLGGPGVRVKPVEDISTHPQHEENLGHPGYI